MYNPATIKSEFSGIIGWRQNEDTAGVQLTALTSSSSELYYNDFHSLLTIDNLISATDYQRLHAGDQAAINAAFTGWVQRKTEAGILKAIDRWLAAKFKVDTAKTILSWKQLFQHTASFANTTTSTGKVVGLALTPKVDRNMIVEVKVGLQFTDNQDVTVKLFRSDQKQEIASETITYTGSGSLQWHTVTWELKDGGSFFIAYDQDAITGSAINSAIKNGISNVIPRGGAFPFSRHIQTSAFAADVSGVSELWDIDKNAYTVDTNYGLNLRVNIKCDYTNFVVDNKSAFRRLIGIQVAIEMLRELAYNAQALINRNLENISMNQILYEIDGDTQGRKTGLEKDFQEALKGLTLDTTAISRVCLPCRRRSARIKTIG